MFMFGTVELPVTTDVSGYLSEGIIAVAAVIGVAVGGYVVFKVVKKALSWAPSAFGDSSFDDSYKIGDDGPDSFVPLNPPFLSARAKGFLYIRYDDPDKDLFKRVTDNCMNTSWDDDGVWYDPNEL